MPYSIVKLDQDLRLAILEKVGVYSVRFSIQEPRTLLATKEVLEMPSEMTSGRRTSPTSIMAYHTCTTTSYSSTFERYQTRRF